MCYLFQNPCNSQTGSEPVESAAELGVRSRAGTMKRALLAGALASVALVLAPSDAAAGHACREEARKLHSDLVLADDVEALSSSTRAAAAEHPECRAEYEELFAWYQAGATGEFPFPPEDDPAHNFLGPVGWWWNTIYVDWFGRNTFMMFLFGWELFLLPIGLGLGVLNMFVQGIASVFARGR